MYCVEETLAYLERYQNLTTELRKCSAFNKLSSNDFGEMVSVCSLRLVCNKDALHEELQRLTEESQKHLKAPIVKFSLNKNKIYLKLNRLCYGDCDNELTQFRMRRAGQVLTELIALGGGSVKESADAEMLLLSPQSGSSPSIQVGSVHIAGSTVTSQAGYLQLRRTDLESSDHKGLSESKVMELVNATVVFELLSVKLVKPLVLNTSITPSSATRSNCKGATFVLYNYARVCAILERFEDMVSKMVYKPLSSYHDLDYNLLKGEEWRLVFDFLAEWPSIIAETHDLKQPKLHNIVIFISTFASAFSVFYKYNRVLNDGQEHMAPLMEARIHLLTAVQKVFEVAFSLLGIHSPTEI